MKLKTLLSLCVASAMIGLAAYSPAQAVQESIPLGQTMRPLQYALFDASGYGSTVTVEVQDSRGLTVPIADTAGTKYPAVSLTLAAGSYSSIGWAIGQVKPNGTNALIPPSTEQYRIIIRVVSGSVTINASGTYDNSVGQGYGIATGRTAPNANSPLSVLAGDWIYLGRKIQ